MHLQQLKSSASVLLLALSTFFVAEAVRADGPILWDGSRTAGPSAFDGGYLEGINPEVPVDDSRSYNAVWFALPYTPGLTYLIDRIEFIHGEGTGNVTIQVRSDAGGLPSNNVLTQGTHQLQLPVGFQGADVTPFSLTMGTPYWIVFSPINGSQGSVGAHGAGVEIAYYHSSDGTNWDGSAPTEVWIARFNGQLSTPVEQSTFGHIKAIYR